MQAETGEGKSRAAAPRSVPREQDTPARVRLNSMAEAFQQSLFFVPAVCIVLASILAIAMTLVDRVVTTDALPDALTTTVASSRSILGAIAAGTITAASVVLSLSLVALQLSSSQHSPRVLRNFIGDRSQQVAIGIVVGTFVYCVVVLRVVRAPLEEGGSAFVPNLSVVVAILLGIAALIALLASVDGTAKGLKVESIARQVTAETIEVIRERFPVKGEQGDAALQDPGATMARLGARRREPDLLVRSPHTGWVRQIGAEALLDAAPPGATIEARVSAGTYVMEGTPLLVVHDAADLDEAAAERLAADLCAGIDIGNERTMQQDVDFGVLRLSDIGLRALSPGVNDPNTAVEVVVRLGSVLQALLGRDLSGERRDDEQRTLTSTVTPNYGSYLHAAFDQMREAAGSQMVVYRAMLRTLGQLDDQAELVGDTEARSAIRAAGAEVVAYARRCDVLAREKRQIDEIAERAGFDPEDRAPAQRDDDSAT
jgi:uncharacterized membrane protein